MHNKHSHKVFHTLARQKLVRRQKAGMLATKFSLVFLGTGAIKILICYFLSFLLFRHLSCSRDATVSSSNNHKEVADCSRSLVRCGWSVHICRLWSVSHNAGHHRKGPVLNWPLCYKIAMECFCRTQLLLCQYAPMINQCTFATTR